MHEDYGTELGERVLKDALDLAQNRWGRRLLAAYALGSLAHGGFSAHVSDVDLGLLLADPLEESDAGGIEHVSHRVRQSGVPLADRLSVFWGSVATCSARAIGGRFPPVDRLDLIQSGRLLAGEDVRARMPRPAVRDMVLEAASITVKSLASPDVMGQLSHPARLVQAGVRPLTKRVLFPVRFLFTARTGQVGATDLAVEHFAAVERGPAVDLAARALEWRYAPFDPADASVLACLERGLLPLHRLYIDDYEARLRSYGAADLLRGFTELHRLYSFD